MLTTWEHCLSLPRLLSTCLPGLAGTLKVQGFFVIIMFVLCSTIVPYYEGVGSKYGLSKHPLSISVLRSWYWVLFLPVIVWRHSNCGVGSFCCMTSQSWFHIFDNNEFGWCYWEVGWQSMAMWSERLMETDDSTRLQLRGHNHTTTLLQCLLWWPFALWPSVYGQTAKIKPTAVSCRQIVAW